MPSKELRTIKRKYGEKFMHLCRELFPIILEEEGKLLKILESSFAGNSRTLGEDLSSYPAKASFKEIIYKKMDRTVTEEEMVSKTPYELLDEAGYELIECHTEEEIQRFRKYYADKEELCTFNGGRLDRSVVYFAVKKDIENIRREDFNKPEREDEYGTSVMSIQFNKIGLCTVSIKNRYNHRVHNPDATFGNDLDRIIPGLTNSFGRTLLKEKNLRLNNANKEEFKIPGYVVASDGRYYKYNMEVNGIYYCPSNTVILGGEPFYLDPSNKILLDSVVLNTKDKTISMLDNSVVNAFVDGFKDLVNPNIQVNINKEKQTRAITIKSEEKETITIEIDRDNNIVEYSNKNLREIKDRFLDKNKKLRKLDIPNVEKIGNLFCYNNKELEELNLNVLKEVKDGFLTANRKLNQISAPNLKRVGSAFCEYNTGVTELDFTHLEETGNNFFSDNPVIEKINVPNLKKVGDHFCSDAVRVTELDLGKLEEAGGFFLSENERINKINIPKLEKVGHFFCSSNKEVTELDVNSLKETGLNFFGANGKLEKLNAPKLKKVASGFCLSNENISELSLESLEEAEDKFFAYNRNMKKFSAPKLKTVGESFFFNNNSMRELNLENLEEIGTDFFCTISLSPDIKIPKVNMPKRPDKEEDIKEEKVIWKDADFAKTINSKDIAELSKTANMRLFAVELAKRAISKFKYKTKNLLENTEEKDEEKDV